MSGSGGARGRARARALWGTLGALLLLQGATLLRLAPTPARGPEAPPQEFSAARARERLARILGDERPHPTGTPALAALRERLLEELRALGCAPTLQEAWVWSGRGRAAPVVNVLARLPGTPESSAPGQAVLLLCHYDSVPAGPGASDDGLGLAAALEIARALQAGLPLARPVLLLCTDGEELGLLGARAFVNEHPALREVGAVVNLEARGTSGPSFMFQTSRGNAPLVGLLAGSLPRPLCSSLFPTVYELLPNDTDLTVFLEADDPPVCFNFACIADVDRYHTPLDDLARQSPDTLQHEGENGLGLVRGLAAADLPALRRVPDRRVYFDLLGLVVLQWPEPASLPLALLAAALLAGALVGLVRRGWLRARGLAWGALLWSGGLALSLAAAHGLTLGLAALSGSQSPWAATPLAGHLLFWALPALVGGGLTGLLLPRAGAWGAWGGAWLGWCGGAIALAALLPGACFTLLAPALVAGAGGLAVVASGRRELEPVAWIAPALAAATLWLPMARGLEWALGLMLKLPVTLAAGLILGALTPLLPAAGRARFGLAAAGGALTLACAVLILLGGPHSAERPLRLNIGFEQEAGHEQQRGQARWKLDERFGRAPAPLRALAGDATPEAFPAPELTVLEDRPGPGTGRTLRVRIRSPRGAWGASLRLERAARALTIEERRLEDPDGLFGCDLLALPAAGVELTIELSEGGPLGVALWDTTGGLPAQGEPLLRARPVWAVPSQLGDTTVVRVRREL